MATIAELNIRLGLLTKDFDRQLRGMERKLQRSADKLSRIGNDLSTAISLPLAGIGIAAIKSAGDIEALRLALNATMQDAGRSTQEATAELEALRKAAEAPGLDFEQAVKGSIRLQNVGFAAEDARGILTELANAVALTGGTAQELDGVTRQFAQMISKGRILQEDLVIIQENMPAISKAMEEAFGTRSAERLRELGVTAEDFIKGVTQQFTELPRVSGGIKNSLVNLFVGLKLEAARLGEEINKAFDIGNAADGILKAVRAVVDAFAGLSDGTKRVVVGLAGVAIAAGPVIAVFGRILSIYATVKTSVLGVVGAFQLFAARAEVLRTAQAAIQAGAKTASTATEGLSLAFAANTKAAEASRRAGRELGKATKDLSGPTLIAANAYNSIVGAVQKATVAFRALNVAQKALVIGGAIAAIAGLVYVISELTGELSAAEKAQISVNEVTRKAGESIASEKVQATELIGVLKDQNATRDQQQRALKALQAISPEHFRNLDLEKSKVGDIDKALDSYIDSLLRAAKAKQAFARLEEIERLRSTLIETADPTIWQTLKNAVVSVGNGISYAGLQANSQASNFVKLSEELDAEEKALRDVIKANGDFVQVAKEAANVPTPKAPDPKGFEEAANKAELYRKALASIQAVADKGDILGADVVSEQVTEIGNQIERLLESGFKPASKEIQHLRSMLEGLFENIRIDSNLAEIERKVRDALILDQDLTIEARLRIEQEGVKFDLPELPTIEIPEQVVSIRADVQGQAEIDSLTAAANKGIEASEMFRNQWEQAADVMNGLKDRSLSFSDAIQQTIQALIAQGNVLQATVLAAADAMGTAFAEAEGGFNKMALAALAAGAKVIKIAIQEGVARAVASALSSVPFPFNLAAATIAGGVAAGLFSKAISAIGVPALAEGGVVTKPTLALIGEYPGAANDPEIIAPESKLRKIFDSSGGGGGILTAIIKGDDLQFVLDRAGARRGRTR